MTVYTMEPKPSHCRIPYFWDLKYEAFLYSKYHALEVGNLGDNEAADNADFNALEVPPGGVAESSPSHPD